MMPLIFARRIRFSAARYSFRSNNSWSTVPVMYANMCVQIINPVLVSFAELRFYVFLNCSEKEMRVGKPNALKSLSVIDFCRFG
jgi:hypothetical protein